MSLLYPDLVRITQITVDTTFKTEAQGTPIESAAQVEINTEIRYTGDGKPLDPDNLIMLPDGTPIKKGDKVEVLKLHGYTLIEGDEDYGPW